MSPLRRLLTVVICGAAVLGAVGCGAAAVRAAGSGAGGPVATSATGSAANAGTTTAAVSSVCAATADATDVDVVRRIYAQAVDGRLVASVTRRLGRSAALSSAVAAGDRRAIAAAVSPLWRNQIRRLIVTDSSGRVLYERGRTPALAPFSRPITDRGGKVVGRYTAAVSSDAALTGIASHVTGGRVAIRSASGRVLSNTGSGHGPARTVVAGTAFPSGAVAITLAPPAVDPRLCGADAAATHALTVAAVGRRLFATEAGSAQAVRVLAHVTGTRAFQDAVAARSASALRAQIVRFFADPSLHVVRIRATDPGGALIGDVGGPYVLAPASAPVRRAGHRIGTVTLAVQDDTGYIKLLSRFTGAAVALQAPNGPVPGSDQLPSGAGRQQVRYTVGAFPSGPLDVTLSVPPLGASS